MTNAKRATAMVSSELSKAENAMYPLRKANHDRSTRNSISSPLLRLPAELRNLVYKSFARCVFGGHVSTLLLDTYKKNPSSSLLFVCRQTYLDTFALPYKLNLFAFDHWLAMTRFLSRRSPEQQHAIRGIQLKPRRDALIGQSFCNFGDGGGEFIDGERLAGVSSLDDAVGEERDVGMLVVGLKGMKAGIVVLVGEYGDEVGLAVEC